MAVLEVGFKGTALTALNKLKGLLKDVDKGLEQVGAEARDTGDDIETMANKSVNSLKKLVAGFAVWETGRVIIGRAITDFMSLEDSILAVQKTSGLSGEGLDQLTDKLKDMSTTMNGFHIDSLLSIAEIAGQLGIKGVDNIEAFTKEVQYMASSSKLSAEEAGIAFAQLANVLQVDIKEINHVTSAFTKLASTTTATEGQIVDFTQRLAGAGKTLELTNAEIIGIGATLKDIGISAEVGGTAMSDVFAKMATDTKNFAKIANISLDDFTDKVMNEPRQALELFLVGLNKLDKIGRLKALKEAKLSGSGMSSMLLKLASNTDKLTANIKTATQAYKEGNATQKEYEISAQSLSRELTKVQSAIKLASAELGEKFVPIIKAGADATLSFIEFINEFDDELIITAKTVAVATGAIILFNGALSASPIGRAIVVLTALSVAVIEVADAYDRLVSSATNELVRKGELANLKQEAKIADEYGKRRNTMLSQQLYLQEQIAKTTNDTTLGEEAKIKALTSLGDSYNVIRTRLNSYEETLSGVTDSSEVTSDSIKELKGNVKEFSEVTNKVINGVNFSFNNLSTDEAKKKIEEIKRKMKEVVDVNERKQLKIDLDLELGKINNVQAVEQEIKLLKEKLSSNLSQNDRIKIELSLAKKQNELITTIADNEEEAHTKRAKNLTEYKSQLEAINALSQLDIDIRTKKEEVTRTTQIREEIKLLEESLSVTTEITEKQNIQTSIVEKRQEILDRATSDTRRITQIKEEIELLSRTLDLTTNTVEKKELELSILTKKEELITVTTQMEQDALNSVIEDLHEIQALSNIDISIGVATGDLTEIEGLERQIELLKEKLNLNISITERKQTELEIVTKRNEITEITTKLKIEADEKEQKRLEDLVSLEEARRDALDAYKDATQSITQSGSLERSIRDEIDAINSLRIEAKQGLLNSDEVTKITNQLTNETMPSFLKGVADAFNYDKNADLNNSIDGLKQTLGSILGDITLDIIRGNEIQDGAVNNALVGSGNPYAIALGVGFEMISESLSEPMNAFQAEASNRGKENKSINDSLSFLNNIQASHLDHTKAMREHLKSMDSNFNTISIALSKSGGISGEGFAGGESASQNFGGAVEFLASMDILGTGLLSGVVGGLLGGSSSKVIEAGIDFGEQTVEEFLSGVEAQNFETKKKTKSAVFGAFSSTSYSTKFGDLGTGIEDSFQSAIQDAFNLIVEAGVSLDLNEQELRQSVNSQTIDLGKFDFLDKTESEIREVLTGVFGRAIGEISSASIPEIEAFRHSGEEYLTALVRVSTGVEQAQQSLLDIGIDSVAFGDIKNKNGDVFEAMIRESLLQFETVIGAELQNALDFNLTATIERLGITYSGVGEILNGLDIEGKELITTYQTLLSAQEDLRAILGQGEINQAVIDGAGSIDNLINSQTVFLNDFFSETERMSRLQSELNKELSDVGVDTLAPTTSEGYRELIESLDTSTENGALQYGALIGMIGEFKELIGLTDSANAQIIKKETEQSELLDKQLSELKTSNDLAEQEALERQRSLEIVQNQLDQITVGGADVTNTIINDTGGFSALTEAQDTFLENFHTEEERLKVSTEQLRREFFALGITTMPKTREELRGVVEGLDLLTSSGQETYAGVLTLLDSFLIISDPIEDATKKNEEYAESLIATGQAYDDIRQSITDTISQLLGIKDGEKSTESKFRQLVEFNKLQDSYAREAVQADTDPSELSSIFSNLNDVALNIGSNFGEDERLINDVISELKFDRSITNSSPQKVEIVNSVDNNKILEKIGYIMETNTEEARKQRKILFDMIGDNEDYYASSLTLLNGIN